VERVPALVVLARVLLASVFVFSAVEKTLHFPAAVREVEALAVLPAPAVVAVCVILTQAVGSVLLFFRRSAWLGAALLIVFTFTATALAHGFWRENGAAYMRELTTFLEHLGIIGGLIFAGISPRIYGPDVTS
jgi:transmembrane protein